MILLHFQWICFAKHFGQQHFLLQCWNTSFFFVFCFLLYHFFLKCISYNCVPPRCCPLTFFLGTAYGKQFECTGEIHVDVDMLFFYIFRSTTTNRILDSIVWDIEIFFSILLPLLMNRLEVPCGWSFTSAVNTPHFCMI
jgi:hypothetical protein